MEPQSPEKWTHLCEQSIYIFTLFAHYVKKNQEFHSVLWQKTKDTIIIQNYTKPRSVHCITKMDSVIFDIRALKNKLLKEKKKDHMFLFLFLSLCTDGYLFQNPAGQISGTAGGLVR